MKKVLYLFALVVAVLTVAIAITVAVNAPPVETHVEGMLYVWNGAERREEFLKAWKIVFGGLGAALFFGGMAAIVDRLERIEAKLKG